MKLHKFSLSQESENETETAQTQSGTEIQFSKRLSICPLCSTFITWVNDVPIELNGTVHLSVCNMGRF